MQKISDMRAEHISKKNGLDNRFKFVIARNKMNVRGVF